MSEGDIRDENPRHILVVIGRQYGGGGRTIGKLVAKRLGIPYYDKELLTEAARSLGWLPEKLATADERRPSPFLSLLQGAYGIADNFHSTSMSPEKVHEAQSGVIRKICSEGSCVIVGRTADHVMRDHPGLTSVFLHAPVEHRARKIVERKETSSVAEAMEMARRHDKDRESYYNYFTGKNWGKASNYHLSIDSSSLSEEDVADMIVDYVKKKNACITVS